MVDLTVAAIPFYVGSMYAEHRHYERQPSSTAGSYERRDTRASMTMGTLSLLAPLAARAVAPRIAPQRSVIGKALAVTALAAGVTTAVADQLRDRSASPHRRRLGARIAAVAGPTAIVTGGVATCSAWALALHPRRLWERRLVADRGRGLGPSLAAIAGWDFIYYWNHRLMHEARYMWAIHVVHHSSQRYNLSTAVRQPVADSLGTFAPYGVLSLAGIHPALIDRARGINLLYQYWIHTEAIGRLGVVEEIFNTASHHRVHHGSNQRYIDRNHGSILIVWDRLFGTFQREDEPVVYGLTKNVESYSPWRIATQEYADIRRDVAAATTWRDRLSFVVRGPGWAYRRHAETVTSGLAGAAA